MLTGGAAIPIVADVAVAVGSGTAVFGAADAIEGTQDIYYGSTGDIDSTAVNGIKDDLFQGNEDAYYLTENAFAFAASAMIPIGQASTAGNLTFKSTATIVAKEGISMGAGAGAQKITTDVTGNDTAGMVAGMVASGVTAKGLNGIEAEANKLAKAPKGIDGVTEGAGNLAEDVGKAGKGLEGAAKGAESAAEDAGKVVESGGKTTYKILNTSSAEDVNKIFKDTMGYEPPYKPGTSVTEIQLTENATYVRVYDKVNSRMQGGWVMKAEDIVGLTPQEIQNKFALPNTPKYICDVNLEAVTRLRTGEVNPLFGFDGGGQQYDLIINGKNVGTFTNERIIGQ